MNTNAIRFPIRAILFASLPVLMAVGCAGHGTKVESEEQRAIEQSTPQAISNMEAYVANLDQERTPEVELDDDKGSAEAGDETAANESATAQQTLAAEMAAQGAPVEAAFEGDALSQPDKLVFNFGFDKSEVSEEDLEILQQHAEYLLENPGMTLVISGHSDNRGPKAYNQYLSEQRAKRVEAILVEQGVPESQIEVQGLGDDIPLNDASNWRENRRVELEYQDSFLVSNP